MSYTNNVFIKSMKYFILRILILTTQEFTFTTYKMLKNIKYVTIQLWREIYQENLTKKLHVSSTHDTPIFYS